MHEPEHVIEQWQFLIHLLWTLRRCRFMNIVVFFWNMILQLVNLLFY